MFWASASCEELHEGMLPPGTAYPSQTVNTGAFLGFAMDLAEIAFDKTSKMGAYHPDIETSMGESRKLKS